MNQIIIDVREADEYEAEHVPNSIPLPLSKFNQVAPGALENIAKSGAKTPVLIMCRSGARAKIAQKQIEQLGFAGHLQTEVFSGGILEWKKQGKPIEITRRAPLPIMRQVQLIAGSVILVFTLLSLWVNPNFAWGAAFVGAGLTIAGATGFCGMGELLCRMPWNQGLKSNKRCG